MAVGFYNVENLFDTIDDPNTFDGEYLPDSMRQWNTDKYQTKINNLAKVISSFEGFNTPDFLGLCEVENRKVVEDLVAADAIKAMNYQIVHYESKDARGIDVAGIYNSNKLTLVASGIKRVDLDSFQEITRDILWAKFDAKVGNETFYFLVNHWPSRRGGLEESEPKRMQAALTLKMLKDSLLQSDSTANLVILGDFNDEPVNKSITETLGAKSNPNEISNTQVFNAMSELDKQNDGSYCYRGTWNMLDQIMLNKNLVDGKTWSYNEKTIKINNPEWLRQQDGDYKGYPLRSFGGRKYLAGYSDHFAVSCILVYQSK